MAVEGDREDSSIAVGEGSGRKVAVSRSLDGDILPVTAFDLERLCVGDCDCLCAEGLNSTGGFMAKSVDDFEGVVVANTLAGPVLEGDIERALSTYGTYRQSTSSPKLLTWNTTGNSPRRLACLSCLPLRISSSIWRVRATSSSSRPSFRFAIRARNWSTDSEPSLLALMVKYVWERSAEWELRSGRRLKQPFDVEARGQSRCVDKY